MNGELSALRSALRVKLEDLSWWLSTAERAGNDAAYNADQVREEVCKAWQAVREAVAIVSSEDHADDLHDELLSVGRCLDELRVLGLATESALSPINSRDMLKVVPEDLRSQLVNIARGIRRDEESLAESRKDAQDVLKAMSSGVFLEYVRRNPGKGTTRIWPSFRIGEVYDHTEGYLQSWTECEIFTYPDDKWIIGKTFHHVEADHVPTWTEYSEIPAGEAAAMLMSSEAKISVEDLIYLRELARSQTLGDTKEGDGDINWNKDLGELTVKGKVVRRVAQPKRAKQVVTVLNVFQEEGWPNRIDSPFPSDEAGRQRLREAVRSLNSAIEGIRFEADGTGEGIRYRLEKEKSSPDQESDDVGW